MKAKNTAPKRQRSLSQLPTKAQIARERSKIQATWSTREKKHRRVDPKHSVQDARVQAHVRFIKFLVDLEALNG